MVTITFITKINPPAAKGIAMDKMIKISFITSCMLVASVCSKPSQINDNISNLVTANNIFSFNLYKKIANESGNIFVSPISMSTSLAMLYLGARGSTAKEMEQVLGYSQANVDVIQIHESFKELISSLKAAKDEYLLTIANALLVQSGFSILPEFESGLSTYYDIFFKMVDFSERSTEVVNEINTWVSHNTRNKITELLQEPPPSESKLMILNAVYFKGFWQIPFEKDVLLSLPFYNNGNKASQKNVETMILFTNMPYLRMKRIKAAAMKFPYKGNDISMLIVLPDELDGLSTLERRFSPEDITQILNELRERKIKIYLPKFKLEYSKDLNEILSELGMPSAFGKFADLSGINGGTPKLFVSKITHKTVVEVNQNGTEAASVTDVEITTRSRVLEFRVNRPFLFFIIHQKSGMILFEGRVTEL